MMTLLAPLGLVALAALAIPLLLQLIRRSDERRIPFAAMRYIGERQRPRKSPKLERWLLLVLRCLLLALLAVLMAVPVWRHSGQPDRHWLVFAPGTRPTAAESAATEMHWLAPGFPSSEAAAPAKNTATTSSLIRELDADLPAATNLSIVVPETLGGLDAERLRLGHAVEWQVQTGSRSPTNGDRATLRIAVRAESTAADLPVMRAVIAAWQQDGLTIDLDIAPPAKSIPIGTDWLFWLDTAPDATVENFVRAGGVALLTGQAPATTQGCTTEALVEAGAALICGRPIGLGRSLIAATALTPTLAPEVANAEFPRRLLSLMQAASPAPDQASAAAVAPERATGLALPKSPLDSSLGVLAAALFLVERVLATRRRRSAAT